MLRCAAGTRCPRQYFLHYIEQAQPAFRPVALAFGTAWHAAVGEYLLNLSSHEPASTDDLVDVFRVSLEAALQADSVPVLFEGNEDAGALVDKAREMIDVFKARVPVPDKVIAVEQAFSVQLFHPATGEVLDVPLIGAIDAVVVQDGHVTLLELKSGKNKWSSDQLEYDQQSTAYLMAARELDIPAKAVSLVVTTKAKKPDVQIERLVRHPQDEDALVELAVTVLAAVEAGIDHRIRGWQCKCCPFAGACAP